MKIDRISTTLSLIQEIIKWYVGNTANIDATNTLKFQQ